MTTPTASDAIPLVEPVYHRMELAATLLEQALKSGRADPQCAYLLAVAYKRQGKIAEARAAFRKIADPDANVILQLGLLSFAEKQFAQAEQEFRHAIDIARHQSAKMFELRAATALARLWSVRGRRAAAQELLRPFHTWLRDQADVPDVREARELLADWTRHSSQPDEDNASEV